MIDERVVAICSTACFEAGVCSDFEEGSRCFRERERVRRFVASLVDESMTSTSTGTEHDPRRAVLRQIVMDAAVVDLMLDRCARYVAVKGTFWEEVRSQKSGVRSKAAKAPRPNMKDPHPNPLPGGEGSTNDEHDVKTQVQPLVDTMNRLFERKYKLIEAFESRCAALTEANPLDGSYAEFTQALMEFGGQDIHDAYKECNPDLPDDWCLPGQSRFIRPKGTNHRDTESTEGAAEAPRPDIRDPHPSPLPEGEGTADRGGG